MADVTNLIKQKQIKKIILIGAIIVAVFLVFSSFIVFVPAGQKGVLMNFGAVSERTLEEGINFKIPIVQSVQLINTRVQKFESTGNNSSSRDLQTIESNIAINYRVKADQVANLYKNIGLEYESTIISPALSEVVKSVTALYTAEELITKRPEVSEQMKEQLQTKLANKYIMVDSFNIINFQFSEAFNKAIEEKQIAEQEALKAKYELEKVGIEKEQAILKAEGEAQALKLRKQELNDQIIMLEFINKWDGKMPTYYGGEGLIFSLTGNN
ncbi:MAG: prohibitin family protein [Oscillospiraceae bacterium]|jgi:regulator of protease activity HflC (stomatin/prohibitin superfamily)|nr:prohibitin family protein [Oscillospiraceae bacterium]